MSFKILLVDHDTAAVERIGGALKKAGHELFAEIDTAKVLESLDSIRPDVALVADGLPGMPGAALCMRLKKTPWGSSTPIVFMTTKVPQGEEELSRRLELLGCDRIIDRRTSGEHLLEICQQIVGRNGQGGARDQGPKNQATTQELPKVGKDANRDVPSAASFDDAVRSAFTDGSRPVDGGLDIEAHLDSVFSMGLPGDEPAPTAPPQNSEAARTAPATRPAAPAPEPVRVPKPPAAQRPQAQPANRSRQAEARPEAPRPAPAPAPTQPVAKARAKPAVSPQPVARQTPKAVEQLRLPRVPERAPDRDPGARRWLWPVVGLVVVTLVLGSLAVAYRVFPRGDDDSKSPQVAQASVQTATPTPVVADPVETEPLPEPPPLEETTPSGDLKAPTTEQAVSIPPKPKPKAEGPPAVTETVRRPTPQRAEAPTKAERSPVKTTTPAEPVAAPVRVPEATTAPQRESAPTPEPRTPTPTTTQAAPPQTAVPEKAEPEPTAPAVVTAPVVSPPEVLQRVEPKYSAKAVKGIDNPVVALRVLVDQRGKIARVLVDEGIPGSELEGAAISAVLRWRFRPATENGVPVKAWTTVRFVFGD